MTVKEEQVVMSTISELCAIISKLRGQLRNITKKQEDGRSGDVDDDDNHLEIDDG